jgi:hypothetical protein
MSASGSFSDFGAVRNEMMSASAACAEFLIGRAFARPVGLNPPYRMSRQLLLVAPHDTYGLLSAVTPGNRDGLGGAARHIGSFRWCDRRRISMCPIPGNIICIRLMDIA